MAADTVEDELDDLNMSAHDDIYETLQEQQSGKIGKGKGTGVARSHPYNEDKDTDLEEGETDTRERAAAAKQRTGILAGQAPVSQQGNASAASSS